MKVKCVVDGKEVEREVDYAQGSMSQGYLRVFPKTTANEEVVWVMGDNRPHIIQNFHPK